MSRIRNHHAAFVQWPTASLQAISMKPAAHEMSMHETAASGCTLLQH